MKYTRKDVTTLQYFYVLLYRYTFSHIVTSWFYFLHKQAMFLWMHVLKWFLGMAREVYSRGTCVTYCQHIYRLYIFTRNAENSCHGKHIFSFISIKLTTRLRILYNRARKNVTNCYDESYKTFFCISSPYWNWSMLLFIFDKQFLW